MRRIEVDLVALNTPASKLQLVHPLERNLAGVSGNARLPLEEDPSTFVVDLMRYALPGPIGICGKKLAEVARQRRFPAKSLRTRGVAIDRVVSVELDQLRRIASRP